MRKLRVTRLSVAARAVRSTWVTRWRRTYLDVMSDGFGELLPDMFEWNPGPSVMTELAEPTWGILLLLTHLSTMAKPSDRLV